MIEAGAAGVHFEDQLASEKKCGHLGGKVLVPTGQFIRTLTAARLAADVCGVPTVLIARTDALSREAAHVRPRSARPRSSSPASAPPEGFFHVRDGLEPAIERSLAYAPYADVLWFETSTPDMGEARAFAEAIHAEFPGKLLAYNCSPSFNWRKHLDDDADRAVPEGARRARLQVPVRHARRLPRAQRVDVRARARLRGERHDGVRRAAGARVRARGRTATRRRATSARSAPATSTRSRR